MKAVEAFKELASRWPVVDTPQIGQETCFSGRAVCFGMTRDMEVITLCQWKPGVNGPSWELPPGGIGEIAPDATIGAIAEQTRRVYLAETGYGNGIWVYLGHIMIETGKYRGAASDDHGLKAHLFIASGLERIQDARKPRPNEIMQNLMVPLGEWKEVLDSGLFVEESAVACAYKALVRMDLLEFKL